MVTRLRNLRREHGQALILAALLMPVMLGFAGLVIDVGRMATAKRQVQNAVDASALAGAYRLPNAPSQAASDAYRYAALNGVTAAEVHSITVSKTNTGNDTINVNARRTVDYTFGRVLGLNMASVRAQSRVVVHPVQGFQPPLGTPDAENPHPDFFPYAVWGGNIPPNLDPGTVVTFRANQWDEVNVLPSPKDNPNWDSTSNSFKGFWDRGSASLEDGALYHLEWVAGEGNKKGHQPLEELQAHAESGTPIIVPVIGKGSGNGSNIVLQVIGFVALKLDPKFDYEKAPTSKDFQGTIVNHVSAGGFYRGGTSAPSWLPTVRVPVITK